jgi:hypothetical protein
VSGAGKNFVLQFREEEEQEQEQEQEEERELERAVALSFEKINRERDDPRLARSARASFFYEF